MNPWLKHVLQGLGGGTAIVLGLAAIKAVENRPEFLPQLTGEPVLVFAFGALALVMIERGRRETNAIQLRNVIAQEQLAAGVNALVAKDDQKAREQEILLDHLAVQTGKILAHLEQYGGPHS